MYRIIRSKRFLCFISRKKSVRDTVRITGYSEEEKEEKRNVCDLLDAVEEVGVKRGISLGISQGISEGRNQQIIKQVCIRLKRNKTAETIAEDLEEDIVLIQEMCDVAMDFGPEYNMEKVYEAWEKRESL